MYVCMYVSMFKSDRQKVTHLKTRSSADADNRLDAFSGQSRSTNMVPFHMIHVRGCDVSGYSCW